MAVTREGRQQTEGQRRAQLQVRAAFLREFVSLWPLLNPLDLEGSAPRWLRMTLGLVGDYRARSADVAWGYYEGFRSVELAVRPKVVTAPSLTRPALPLDELEAAARTSLSVMGPVNIRARLERGETPRQAARDVLPQASGSAVRQVLAGGRETLAQAVEADTEAVGWARVTDGDPCAFCALLASRGFVYKTRDAALHTRGGLDRYHDDCGCTAEPAFDHGAEPPGRAEDFLNLYIEAAAGYSGAAARRAFRRAYEAQQRTARAS